VRIFIINTDYPAFLLQFYKARPGLDEASFAGQNGARNASLFGVFDAYSRAFEACGHKAWEVHANNGLMQRRWAEENGMRPPRSWRLPSQVQPLVRRVARRMLSFSRSRSQSLHLPFDIAPFRPVDILAAQVESCQPDVILNQSVSEVGSDILLPMRRPGRLVVGQIASPLPDDEDYTAYDLMISSLPNLVAHFARLGLPARLNRLAFDRRALDAVGAQSRDVDASFVGSLSPAHPVRVRLIEFLAGRTQLDIWGNGLDQFRRDSPIHKRYHGEAWGIDMFRALARSKITINTHIGIAENYANNMRLFEATGMGAMLLTDRKSNIEDMFEPGKEVLCYNSAEECLELIGYYRRNETERARIAAAGQRRTLAEHSYLNRARELIEIFKGQIDAS
jgi:spore maturation protein CgeB